MIGCQIASRAVHRLRHRLLHIAELVLVGVVVWVVASRLDVFADAGRALIDVRWWVVLLALVLELGNLCSHAELIVASLRGVGCRAGRGLVYRVDLASTALGKVLPGGTTVALPFSVRMLQVGRQDLALGLAGLAAGGLLSTAVLAALLPVSSLIAIVTGNAEPFAVGVAVFAASIGVAVLLLRPILRSPQRIARLVYAATELVARGWLRHLIRPDVLAAAAARGVSGLNELASARPGLRSATCWALASWLFDLAALAAIALAMEERTPIAGLPLAFVVGQLAAAVPLTPGGLGVVEATMTAALVAQGMPILPATASVLGWRLFSHWFPLVLGLAVYASRPRPRASGRRHDDRELS